MAGKQFGRYELDRELGRGPLGKVYAAKNLETGQLVVFRGFMRPPDADDARWNQAIHRFHDELAAAQKLDHPHVAKVYESGVMDSLYYVVTEYFEGKTLRQIIDAEQKTSVDEISSILEQVCRAIDYATAHGMSHGDFTPYNLLVLADGNVKVINYGLAHTRNRLGSPYLAPEQLTGAAGDHRSDIFALGAITYELMSKVAAFHGETLEQLCRNIIGSQPGPVGADAPPYLQGIVMKMLEKNPESRYGTGALVLADLNYKKIPQGYEDRVVRRQWEPVAEPGALRTPWERSAYQPPPSLAEYKLDESDLAAARERIRVRRWRMFQLGESIALKIAVAVVVLFIGSTIFDAITASKKEVALMVMSTTGSPKLRPKKLAEMNAWIPVKKDDWIDEGDIMRTDAGSTLTLRMQDGTRLKLGPNTRLEVTHLEFKRKTASKIRDFDLEDGRVWARVRGMRGRESQFSIAAAGGKIKVTGTNIGVNCNEKKRATFVTFDGTSQVESQDGSKPLPAGKGLELDSGKAAGEPQNLSEIERKVFESQTDLQESDSLLASIRQAVVHTEEGILLPVIGSVANLKNLSPDQVNKNYFQQLGGMAKALTAMRAITIAIEGDPEYPEQINLTTLEGIGLKPEDCKRILKEFDGERLLSYQRVPPDGYEFTARANTSKKELLRATHGKVEVVDEAQGGGGAQEETPPSAETGAPNAGR